MTSTRRHLSAFAALALTAMVLPLTATSVAAEPGRRSRPTSATTWSGAACPTSRWSWPSRPTARSSSALKGGVINEYDSLTDTTRHPAHEPGGRGPQLLGPRPHGAWPWIPSSRRAPTSTPCTRTTISWADRAGPKWGDTCPSPNPGGNTDGCMISGKLVRLTTNSRRHGGDRHRRPHRGLVPAVPQPLAGRASPSGPEGALYVTAGDGASFNGPDYGQQAAPSAARRRHPGQPLRRSARRGRRPALPGHPHHQRPARPRRHGPAHQPRHRRGLARQRQLRERQRQRPEGSSPTACATPSA